MAIRHHSNVDQPDAIKLVDTSSKVQHSIASIEAETWPILYS